ncbi:hypothetical protein JW948_10580 [bacterium]|nr:hypothetical protein [bacterium]
MILRNKNPRLIIGVGQIFLIFGVFGAILLQRIFPDHPDTAGWGFLIGLSYGLIFASAVLNITGLVKLRKQS